MLLIQTTPPTRDEALRIASGLVEQHLVACAQLSDIGSVTCGTASCSRGMNGAWVHESTQAA